MSITEGIELQLQEKYGLMMSVEDTANEMKLSESTITSMCKRRDLAAVKTRRMWLVPTQAVIDYLTAHLTEPASKNTAIVPPIINGKRKLIV